jgi:hypothetical protein
MFLEASVTYTDGRSVVEHDERNDARGRKQMDAWCWEKFISPRVSSIAVEITDRRARGTRSARVMSSERCTRRCTPTDRWTPRRSPRSP